MRLARTLVRNLFADGRSELACAWRREFRALERRYGPFDDVMQSQAAGAAMFFVEFQRDTRGLNAADATRTNGKGRRPSAAAIRSLKKRMGLSWASYTTAVGRLEEM